MRKPTKCPRCKGMIGGVQYSRGTSFTYDGISEFACVNGDYRIGRWCGHELKDNEIEKPFCKGGLIHARYEKIA